MIVFTGAGGSDRDFQMIDFCYNKISYIVFEKLFGGYNSNSGIKGCEFENVICRNTIPGSIISNSRNRRWNRANIYNNTAGYMLSNLWDETLVNCNIINNFQIFHDYRNSLQGNDLFFLQCFCKLCRRRLYFLSIIFK